MMRDLNIVIEKELLHDYQEAESGRKLWLEIKDDMHMDISSVLIILDEKNHDFCETVFKLIPAYMEKKRFSKAAIVCNKDVVSNDFFRKKENVSKIDIVCMSDDNIHRLLKYYSLVQFFANIVVISFETPFGRRQLLNSGIVGKEDYIENTFLI